MSLTSQDIFTQVIQDGDRATVRAMLPIQKDLTDKMIRILVAEYDSKKLLWFLDLFKRKESYDSCLLKIAGEIVEQDDADKFEHVIETLFETQNIDHLRFQALMSLRRNIVFNFIARDKIAPSVTKEIPEGYLVLVRCGWVLFPFDEKQQPRTVDSKEFHKLCGKQEATKKPEVSNKSPQEQLYEAIETDNLELAKELCCSSDVNLSEEFYHSLFLAKLHKNERMKNLILSYLDDIQLLDELFKITKRGSKWMFGDKETDIDDDQNERSVLEVMRMRKEKTGNLDRLSFDEDGSPYLLSLRLYDNSHLSYSFTSLIEWFSKRFDQVKVEIKLSQSTLLIEYKENEKVRLTYRSVCPYSYTLKFKPSNFSKRLDSSMKCCDRTVSGPTVRAITKKVFTYRVFSWKEVSHQLSNVGIDITETKPLSKLVQFSKLDEIVCDDFEYGGVFESPGKIDVSRDGYIIHYSRVLNSNKLRVCVIPN